MRSTELILAYGQIIIMQKFLLEAWLFVMSILELLKIIANFADASLKEAEMFDKQRIGWDALM